MIYWLLLLLSLLEVSSRCPSAQKSIFMSFRSLAGRQHMQRLFDKISQQTANYNLSYKDTSLNKNYQISELSYRLKYNSHYQVESFIDEKSVRVRLGRIDLLSKMNYSIKDNQNKTIFQGEQYAFATLDPSFIQKSLALKDGYVQWSPKSTDVLSFSGLWNMQINFNLPEEQQYVLQKMLNYIVPTLDVKTLIQNQINGLFQSNLFDFLNSDHLFSTNQIDYNYSGISLPLTHQISSISVSNSTKGVVAFIDFAVKDAEQNNCSAIPNTFSELNYGGIQELISISTVSFIAQQAMKRGLFDVTLDKSWQSQVFQLFMGDLGNSASFADTYDAVWPIDIKCKPKNQSKVVSYQFDQSHLYVQLTQSCLVQLKNENLIKVDLFLIILVRLTAQKDFLSVKIDQIYSRSVKYEALNPNFKVTNPQVAKMVEKSLLEKMIGVAVFGTKIPLIEKKSPGLVLMPDYMLVYDLSQVLPNSKID